MPVAATRKSARAPVGRQPPDAPVPVRHRPAVRLRAAPPLEPPFDGQGTAPSAGMELLPIDWPIGPTAAERRRPAPGAPGSADLFSAGSARAGGVNGSGSADRAAPGATVPGRPGPGGTGPGGAGPGGAGAGGAGPGAAAAGGAAAARRFVQLCVEVLNGFRPAAHLRPLIPPQRFTDVADQLVRRTVRVRVSRASQRLGRMIRVRRLVVCVPRHDVIEVAVVLDDGCSCWAMAVRMEYQPRGWLCALLQVV